VPPQFINSGNAGNFNPLAGLMINGSIFNGSNGYPSNNFMNIN
jgi:hypothetical protein